MSTGEVPSSPVRIGIVDDDALTLVALSALLARPAGRLVVLWSEPSALAALTRVQESRSVPDAAPKVLLVDMDMDEMPGAGLCARVKSAAPQIAVIGMTAHGLVRYARPLAAAGGQGLVHKDIGRARWLAAITRVAAGQILDVVDGVEFPSSAQAARREFAANLGNELSAREVEVLRLTAEGLTAYSVGRQLNVAESTVRTYLRRAVAKLGATSQTEALVRCARQGLI